MQYQFISSDLELEKATDLFERQKVLAVDLEADAMHSFKEKICLIQMACDGQAFLIDPFEMRNIDPFLHVLENPEVQKIFHGSDFDIRSLDRDYSVGVNHLFDTEIACRFLGVKERGLGALLKDRFNVDVDKRFQKADWARRPLRDDMIEYSVMDVAWLESLCTILTRQLADIGRLSWAQEEFELQTRVRYECNHQPPLFRKFKGAGKMDNRTLAVLENLLQLRYEIAEEKDRPMFKVFSNPCLKILAEEKPTRVEKMVQIKALSRKQADMHGQRCCKAIVEALEIPHKALPSYPRTRRPKKDLRIQKRIKQLKKMRAHLSEEMGMEPGFILNNALVTAVSVNFPCDKAALKNIEHIRCWQVEAFGDEILNVLEKTR